MAKSAGSPAEHPRHGSSLVLRSKSQMKDHDGNPYLTLRSKSEVMSRGVKLRSKSMLAELMPQPPPPKKRRLMTPPPPPRPLA
eukprot:7764774-Karenia_brevis.AAC.1